MENLHADYGLASGPPAAALWAELAAAAELPPEVGGAQLGQALDSPSAEVIASVLVPLLEVLRMAEGEAEAGDHPGELAAMLLALPQRALARALERVDVPDRRRAVDSASRVLPPAGLVPLVTAAAHAYGQTASDSFGGLLAKLAAGATDGEGVAVERAEAGFRELVRDLNNRWAASAPYTGSAGVDVLHDKGTAGAARSTLTPGASRVLQLALETGAVGPMVWGALTGIASEEGIRGIIELLKNADPTMASQVISDQIATVPRLVLLLREQPIDWSAVDAMIGAMGVQAARPLAEQLILADARAVRRALMDRLVKLGPDIRPVLMGYLSDDRWFVVRNMLLLLRETGCFVEPVMGDNLATHPEPRIRREALLLRLEHPESRDRALSDALRDPDRQVLRTALRSAGDTLPPSAVLVLARRLAEPAFPAELRVPAITLLGRAQADAAREALLRVVDGGRSLLGRPILAPKSTEVLAALTGLARSWPTDSRARDFLRLAGRTADPEMLAAIESPAPQEKA